MIYWIGALSVLLAVEIVFIGTCLSIFFPPQPSAAAVHDLFTTYQHIIFPKHDILFLRLLIIVSTFSFIALMRFLWRMNGRKYASFKYFVLVQAAVVLTETFFLFKYAVFHFPFFLNGFCAALCVSAIIKIFTPEVIKYLRAFNERLKVPTPILNLSIWLTVSGMVLLPLIIWVPDVEGAVARMFCGEHFHHMDWLLMAAGWVHISGNILGVDNISRYGIGAPVIVSEIAHRFLGRFDYVNAVIVVMVVSVLYYWIWYYALRLVLKDAAWAFIAIFLGLRLHFFNAESFPCIFTYPQVTPLRCFIDSLFFLSLIMHVQSGRKRGLYAASALSGFYVFYITGEGLYALSTFYLFLVLREFFVIKVPGAVMKRLDLKQAALLLVIPWVVMLASFGMVVGGHVFEGKFWFDQFEYVRFYQQGNSVALMINNLGGPFVERAAIAFLLPVVYLFILMVFIGKLMQKTLKEDGLIMACACIYLLMCYHYNAMIATGMPSFLRNGVVIAMIFVYILKGASAHLGQYHQRIFKLACGIAVFVITVTTHQFLLHPNIFNFSRNPMTHPVVSQVPDGRKSYFSHLFISYPDAFKLPINGLGEKDEMLVTEDDFSDDNQLKAFYRKESDYSQDAALIQSLTASDEKVPLVSSFENLILMQAQRRPFFYTYFMVNSQPRRMRKFPVMILYTKSNLQREIDRIEKFKPPYIFVEKTYLVSPFPQAYLYDNEDLVDTLSYIFAHYQPYKAGEFLVALKRK